MDYNELFEDKNKCRDTIQLLFNIYLNKKKVQVKSIDNVEEPKYNFFDCLRYNYPYNYIIDYTVGIEDEPETDVKGQLIIPKMHDGSYLIKSHGELRMRTPVSLLKVSKPITFFGSGKKKFFSIYGALTIHGVTTKSPTVKFNGDLENTFYLKNIFDRFNVEYTEDITGGPENEGTEYPTKLLVDGRVRDKFRYLFEGDDLPLDEESGKYLLSYQNVHKLWAYSLEMPYKVDQTTVFDLVYTDSTRSIQTHFRNCPELRQKLRSMYYRSGNKGVYKISTTPIQRYVDSYYNMQSEAINDLQSTTDTNALEQLTQQSKVYILDGGDGEKKRLDYNGDFVGVICPVDTPEGANSSLRNSMARDVEVEGETLYIKVRDPKSKKIKKLTLVDYYYSRILVSTSYDFIDEKIVPDKNGKIQIQYKGDYYYDNPDGKFDYIRMDKSAMLSYSAAMIPFLNMTDATRIAMSASSMNNQAIPTVGCKPPIVATGVGREVYEKSTLNVKAIKPGKVTGILDQYVKVKNDDGTESIYASPPPITTHYMTANYFNIDVKVGDKVKKDQVLISVNSFKNGELSLTVPMVVAYTNVGGYDYEDAIVISESAAKRLGHKTEIVVEIPIIKSNRYIFDKETLSIRDEYTASEASEFQFLNDWMLPEIGSKALPRSMIFTYMHELDAENDKNVKLRRLLNDDTVVYKKEIFRVPGNVIDGVIKDIKVTANDIGSPVSQIKRFYDKIHDDKKNEIKEFTGVRPPDEEPGILEDNCEGVIKVTIEYLNVCKIADKVANMYGSKGLISKIIPDNECPTRDDGTPIDIFLPPESILGRKNISQIFECTLGEVGIRAHKIAKKLIEKKNFQELRNLLNIIYVTDRFSDYTEKQLRDKVDEYDGYFQIIASAYEERYNKEAMFKILDYLKMPRNGLSVLHYPPSKRFPKGKDTKQGVVTGVTAIRRLHFLPEYKAKSTATRTDSEETATGWGLTKNTGQKLGNQETYAILASGNYDLLSDLSPKKKRHELHLNTELLPLGLRLMVEEP